MKVVLSVSFVSRNDNVHRGTASLDIQTDFAPSPDIEFQQAVWHQGKKPVTVSYAVDDGSFYVFFGNEEYATEDQCRRAGEMYRDHGWTVTGQ